MSVNLWDESNQPAETISPVRIRDSEFEEEAPGSEEEPEEEEPNSTLEPEEEAESKSEPEEEAPG